MNRFVLLPALVLIFALVIILLVTGDTRQRSILLIVADTLRADRVGCYGYEKATTPNIDKLAAHGTLFTNYYTVVPSTLASFTSMFTSLHPKDHGVFRNGFKAHEDLLLLSDLFRKNGYEAAAFVASYSMSKEFGLDRGFDLYDEQFTQSTPLRDNALVRSASDVTTRFLQWVRGRDGDRPFLALVHYFDPHWPYNPPPHVMEKFDAHRIEKKEGDLPTLVTVIETLRNTGGRPTDYAKNMHNLYCSEVRFMDNQIGRILKYLKKSGEEEETILVFTADHGETFWDHDDYWNHGLYVYDSTVHIPLIFSCPGFIPLLKKQDALLCNLDMGPTLLDLAGIEIPPSFTGRSFSPLLLHGSGIEQVPLFSEASRPTEAETDAPRPNILKAKSVRKGPWKLITFPYEDKNRKELFNMEKDPHERENLVHSPEQAARAKELEALLNQWADNYHPPARSGTELDDDVKEKLEGIGYH